MVAIQSTETHNITLKKLALFRPKLRDSYNTNQIARFLNYYCYSVNVIRDSIIIPLMIKENGARFYTVSFALGYPLGTRASKFK